MKIYLASVNLADSKKPRILPHRLFSFRELRTNLFGIMDVFEAISRHNKKLAEEKTNEKDT